MILVILFFVDVFVYLFLIDVIRCFFSFLMWIEGFFYVGGIEERYGGYFFKWFNLCGFYSFEFCLL